jgi:transposase
MIGGMVERKFIAPFTFSGSCRTEVFQTYLEKILLPALKVPSIIVLDNAAFHKSKETKALVETAGHKLKFLPPYSPDLNPIEHCWHQAKAKVRMLLREHTLKNAVNSALKEMSYC